MDYVMMVNLQELIKIQTQHKHSEHNEHIKRLTSGNSVQRHKDHRTSSKKENRQCKYLLVDLDIEPHSVISN